MNKVILSFVLGFGLMYFLNKKNKDLILHGFLASIIILLVSKKFLPNFEGLENSTDKSSNNDVKTPTKMPEAKPDMNQPVTTAKMPTADFSPMSVSSATLDTTIDNSTKKEMPRSTEQPINDKAMSTNTLVPPSGNEDPTMSGASPLDNSGINNTNLLPASVEQPQQMSNKNCTLSECQTIFDQRNDPLIPHNDLANEGKLALPLSNEEREDRWQNGQYMKGLSKLFNMFKQYNSKGSDRMLTSGLEGPGYSGTQSKNGAIKILNLNVLPGRNGNVDGNLQRRLQSQLQNQLNNMGQNKENMASTNVISSKGTGVPSDEQYNTNYSSRNQQQIDLGTLNYTIPLDGGHKKWTGNYSYINPEHWRDNMKTWKAAHSHELEKYGLETSTEQTITDSMGKKKALALPYSTGVFAQF